MSSPYFLYASGLIDAQSINPKWSKHITHIKVLKEDLLFVCLIDDLQRPLLLLFKHEDGIFPY